MTVQLAIPVPRQLLQIAGGVLISRGYLDAESHEAVTGIVLNAATFAWWLYDRRKINRAIKGQGQ